MVENFTTQICAKVKRLEAELAREYTKGREMRAIIADQMRALDKASVLISEGDANIEALSAEIHELRQELAALEGSHTEVKE